MVSNILRQTVSVEKNMKELVLEIMIFFVGISLAERKSHNISVWVCQLFTLELNLSLLHKSELGIN